MTGTGDNRAARCHRGGVRAGQLPAQAHGSAAPQPGWHASGLGRGGEASTPPEFPAIVPRGQQWAGRVARKRVTTSPWGGETWPASAITACATEASVMWRCQPSKDLPLKSRRPTVSAFRETSRPTCVPAGSLRRAGVRVHLSCWSATGWLLSRTRSLPPQRQSVFPAPQVLGRATGTATEFRQCCGSPGAGICIGWRVLMDEERISRGRGEAASVRSVEGPGRRPSLRNQTSSGRGPVRSRP